MPNEPDTDSQQGAAPLLGRRELLKSSVALAILPIMAAASAGAQAAANPTNTGVIMADAKSEEFINVLADLMAHSTRTPILR